MAQPPETEPHRDFAGERADGAGWNRVDAALLDVAGVVEPVLFFGEIHAAAAGSDDHADAAQLVARHGANIHPGVFQRLGDARHRQRHGARNMRPVLYIDVQFLVEFIGYFARHLHGQTRRIEAGDPAHPAHAVPRGLPEALAPNTIGADRADSRNDYAPHRFIFAFGPSVSIG